LEFISQAAPSATVKEARENIEKELLQQALKKHLGGISSAATAASRLIL
jgi:hypothetical protein